MRAPSETSDTGTKATPAQVASTVTSIKKGTPIPKTDAPVTGGLTQAQIDEAARQHQADMDAAKKKADDAAIAAGTMGSGPNGAFVVGDPGYKPNDPTHTAPVVAPTLVNPGGGGDPGALQIITDALNSVGLGSLAGNAWDMWNKGMNMNAIMNDPKTGIRASEAYKQRFPGMKALNDAGHGISELDYIAKEETDRGLLYQYLGDAAKPFDTVANLGNVISGFKSSAEFQDHLQGAHDALNASPETKAWLKNTYNLSDGDLAAYWLNPDVAGLDIQRRDQAGQLAGISTQSGFGTLTQSQAEDLANSGVTNSQAHNVFGQIGQEGEFMKNLPGAANDALTQQQMLDAAYKGGDALAALNRVKAGRVAQFQEGGQMAQDSKGVVGLGSAATL